MLEHSKNMLKESTAEDLGNSSKEKSKDTENDPRSSQLDNIDKNVGRIRKDMMKMFKGFN
ncbi:hypothetical protein L195_g063262, partial [Trifolium pratense]